MSLISTPEEAAARIAYLCSDVVLSVQSAQAIESAFSPHLNRLAAGRTKGHLSSNPPAILPVPRNADPLLSTYTPLSSGKLVSVTASSTILLHSIPHLYKLAEYPLVLHVALQRLPYPDFSEIASIRECGFCFLHSETLRESQDLALTAHALALRSGKGVIHFFDPTNSATNDPIPQENIDVIESLLPVETFSRRRRHSSDGPTLYADLGRVATIPEDAPPEAGDSATASEKPQSPLPVQKAPTLPAVSSTASSQSGSSRRDSSTSSRAASSAATTVDLPTNRPVTHADVQSILTAIWKRLAESTGRSYAPIAYTGPENAESAVFVFGSTAVFAEVLDDGKTPTDLAGLGLVTARVYRPWLGTALADNLPKTIRRMAVVEQVRRKTTKWGPMFLDILSGLNPNLANKGPITLVSYKLGRVERSTAIQALRGVFHNLMADNPIQGLDIGNQVPPKPPLPVIEAQQPQLETPYIKILNQLFAGRLHLANQTGAQTAGISPHTAASPEYGFGSLIARMERRQSLVSQAREAANSQHFVTDSPKQWLAKWALCADDANQANQLAPELIARLSTDGSQLASQLLSAQSLFVKESQWLVGSDAWAYDLGNSGVHHVLASGANVNMLIIDSQPYEARAAADATRRKKDIGLYAMNMGNAYVASVAVYGSYTQVLQAILEADRFDGPSVVMAYLPYHRHDDSAVTVLQETKKAVDLGYWPLYRWEPGRDEQGEPTFHLDSERIKKDLEDFLRRDNQLTQLMNRDPTLSSHVDGSYGLEVRKLQKRKAKEAYEQMLEGLYGAPLTILYASDNGNAESLSKRLVGRGKARGLKTIAMAMDDYPIEDLPTEANVVFVTSTAGQGEFPQNGRTFWETVKNASDMDLSSLNYSVFALGDSHYWPRKEDKHYYNKPGKDLDSRISYLGAKPLVGIGLGDDQDPDGYQTAYADWEPGLWQALQVADVEGLPEEPPPITNEDIKVESNYLRGTIGQGLQDTSTGAISASDQQLTKFHGTYMQDDRDLRDERKAQGLEPAYSFMIRCRLPGGVATPAQWMQMDTISADHGNETMKLTTRQTFQFHGVVKAKLRPAMQAINRALMTTIAACGDVNRNVMCSSLPHQSAYHAEVHAVSQRISDHLLPSTTAYHEIWLKDDQTGEKTPLAGPAVVDQEPLYGSTYLPRKYKITIAIPPHNDTDVYAHDVGLIAIKSAETGRLAGFNVLAGGGMGVTHNNKKTYPRTGWMMGYVATESVHVVCEKIMLVQRDHGDRKNRKHARLKYTMDDMGNEVFKAKVEELLKPLDIHLEEPRPFHFDSNIDSFGWQTDERGLHHFTFFIENGRVEDTADFPMRTGLREIAKIHQGEFRLTGNQHLILSNVSDEAKPQMVALMKKYKLDNTHFSGLRQSSSACVAFPTCGLAMAESERYLPELISKLEGCLDENGLSQDSIVMRMTGCPNGCARPWLAEVAFVGKAYGAYNMYLGGGYHGQRLNKLYRHSIMEEEILTIMRDLLGRWAREREAGEHFGDWTIRAGLIKETRVGREFHDDVAADDDSDAE